MKIKKAFFTLISISVVCFIAAYIFSKANPYSMHEAWLILLGVIIFLISYICLIILAKRDNFLNWLFLISGWVIIFLDIVVMQQTPQDNVQPEVVIIVPLILLSIIFLILSLKSFLTKNKISPAKLNYLGIILSALPLFVILIMILFSVF